MSIPNPFWDDIHLVVDWVDGGKSILDAGGTIRNPSSYFHSGLTYPERTTSSFGPRILPAGCVFSTAGLAIHFAKGLKPLCYLGLLLSRQGQFLIEMSLGGGDSSVSGSAARHYTNGMLNRMPFPDLSESTQSSLADVTSRITHIRSSWFDIDETARSFASPLPVVGDTLEDCARHRRTQHLNNCQKLAVLTEELELKSEVAFGLEHRSEKEIIAETVGPSVFSYGDADNPSKIGEWLNKTESELIAMLTADAGKGSRFITKNSQLVDRKLELISHLGKLSLPRVISLAQTQIPQNVDRLAVIADVLSFVFGVVLGRWDVRRLTVKGAVQWGDLFAALPSCSPATLLSPDGLSAQSGNIVSEEWLRARPDANSLPPTGKVKRPTIPDSTHHL